MKEFRLVSSVKICFWILFILTLVIKISLYVLKRYYDFWLLVGNINGDAIGFIICILTGIILSTYVFYYLVKYGKRY